MAGSSLIVIPGVGDTIREPKWYWLWFCAALQLLFVLRNEKIRHFPFTLIPLLAYILVQPLLLQNPREALPFILSIFSLVILGLAFARSESCLWEKWLAGATVLQLFWGALQILKIDPIFTNALTFYERLPVGFLGQHTIFGAWIAPLAWFWFGKKRRLLFVFCTAGAFATGSAFTALSWLCGLIAYLIWNKPWRAWLALPTLILAAIFGATSKLEFFNDQLRYQVWRRALSASLYRPWFGYGMDSFRREFPYLQGVDTVPWMQAHNEYLELLFDAGLVGIVLAFIAFCGLWLSRKNWWRQDYALPWFLILIALMANGIGNLTFHIAPMALLGTVAYFKLCLPTVSCLSIPRNSIIPF